jgi:hypothetical protein
MKTTEQPTVSTAKIPKRYVDGYSRPSNRIGLMPWPADVKLLLLILRAWTYRGRVSAYASDEVLTGLTSLYWRRFERARAWAVEADLIDYTPGQYRGQASHYVLKHPVLTWEPKKKGAHSDPLLAWKGDHPVSAQGSNKALEANEAEARRLRAPEAPPREAPLPKRWWRPNEAWQNYFTAQRGAFVVKGHPRYVKKVHDILNDAAAGEPLSIRQLELVAKVLRHSDRKNAEKIDQLINHLEADQ